MRQQRGGLFFLAIAAVMLTAIFIAQAAQAQQVMPIEVILPTFPSVSVTLPMNAGTANSLVLSIGGLHFSGQATVQVNGGAPIALVPATTPYPGLDVQYNQVYAIPGGAAGASVTLTFTLLKSDGVVSELRVLSIAAMTNADGTGSNLVPAGDFVQDNPATWTAPSTDPTIISNGQAIFNLQTLNYSPLNPSAQNETCVDCHAGRGTQAGNGSDLAYFNYSAASIEGRCQFHGLTAPQALAVASYIFSLRPTYASTNGRPWLPVFQPGAGLDTRANAQKEWAAGWGQPLVNDLAMQATMFPGGLSEATVIALMQTSATYDQRNQAIGLPLLTWNQWLPTVHPRSIWGSTWDNSTVAQLYNNGTLTLDSNGGNWSTWLADRGTFYSAVGTGSQTSNWTPALAAETYSVAQWMAVKMWTTQQAAILAGTPPAAFSWRVSLPFMTSPNRNFIPNGMLTGSHLGDEYLSEAWYEIQLQVADGDGNPTAFSPVDWAYFMDHMGDLVTYGGPAEPFRWLKLLIQDRRNFGPQRAPQNFVTDTNGFSPDHYDDAIKTVLPHWSGLFAGVSSTVTAPIVSGIMAQYLSDVQTYTPSQYAAVNIINPAETFGPTTYWATDWGAAMWMGFPLARTLGADPSVMNNWDSEAALLWPLGAWTAR